MVATKWGVGKIISPMWKISDESPSRTVDFESQTSGNYLLHFYSHR